MLRLNNIYNMDCLDGLRQLDDNSIDLIVTSPPYNVGIEYENYKDNLPWGEYILWCSDWLTECFRVLKDDGRICINHYINFLSKDYNADGSDNGIESRFPLFDIKAIMEKIGYKVSKLVIWNDSSCKKFTAWGSWLSASAPNIQTPTEGIMIAYKKTWKKQSEGESTIDRDTFLEGVSGVWNIGTTTGYTEACFPEKLPMICIELLSYKQDVVLDPFSGSGTTCYVAKGLGRRFIGFEISKPYWEQSISRLYGNPYKVEKKPVKRDVTENDLWR